MTYVPAPDRYDHTPYRRCGRSGIRLPEISLGLWQNFGSDRPLDTQRAIILRAFDLGVTHFDLANNYGGHTLDTSDDPVGRLKYGPLYGSAERNFGRILRDDLGRYRDELIISTKAGYDMWPGPYGDFGSRKYLLASLDQSLARMGLDYVDIFYSHRADPDTPLEETIGALATAVSSGRALYAGISSYSAQRTREAAALAREMGAEGIGCIAFSPLAQGLLTTKYLNGVPEGSRMSRDDSLSRDQLTEQNLAHIRALNQIAASRGQSLAQMALSWVLRDERVTSALIGASSVTQLEENLAAAGHSDFSPEDLAA